MLPSLTPRSWLPRRRPRAAVAAVPAALALLLAGCASQPTSGSAAASSSAPATSTTAAAAATGSLDDVKAEPAKGATAPTLSFGAPLRVAETTSRVLAPGTGAVLAKGQRVTVDYVGVNGKDAKPFDSSYGKSPATFLLDETSVIPGFAKGLIGQKVGSTVLVAIPPSDGYGPQGGVPDAGIAPDDTLLFDITVRSAATIPAQASGTPVAPKAGLPAVTVDAAGKPTITVPKVSAPTALVAQPLLTGKGAPVKTGQTIAVNYTGVVWASGKEFDSSFKRKAPFLTQIGTGAVVAGWDKGLIGKPVGSRVLLVIPPADGYGAAGQPSAGIAGTDTLVFVVDVLDAF